MKSSKSESGITLIALIITIIILVILAVVSLNVMFGDRIIEVATNGVENYVTEQEKEQNEFNNAVEHIKATTNKKPKIEVLKCSNRTVSTMKITAKAIDEDGEKLTYKLYVGTSIENLEEQTEIKENIEQGTEVEWEVNVVDATTTYYYRVEVKDKFSTVDSGIRETNKAPNIAKVEQIDIQENEFKIRVQATDEDGDNITYKVYTGNTKDNVTTLQYTSSEVESGVIVTIPSISITEGEDTYFRVDTIDVFGETGIGEVYCSGTGQVLVDGIVCSSCEGTGICNHDKTIMCGTTGYGSYITINVDGHIIHFKSADHFQCKTCYRILHLAWCVQGYGRIHSCLDFHRC